MSDTFTDAKGGEWLLKLTYGDVKRVNQLIGINLTTVASPKSMKAANDSLEDMEIDDLPLAMRLQQDAMLLADVLYCLVEPQATERGVSDVEFGERLTPETFRNASDIFWRLYHNFFVQSGDKMKAQAVESLMNVSEEDAQEFVDQKIAEAQARLMNSTS